MGFEDLTDVHSRWHPERVEDDLDRCPVGQEGHVFLGQGLRNHTLVAVASGHLVADLKLALHGDEDLDLLDHAGRQVVALRQQLDPLLVELVEDLDLRFRLTDDETHLVEQRRFLERQVLDLGDLEAPQCLSRDLPVFLDENVATLAHLDRFDTIEPVSSRSRSWNHGPRG